MPMWYRGADLRLAMVNSHYVAAVEGAHRKPMSIARGLELVEGSGIGGPLASAVLARDAKAVQSQAMPATIRGERRMLRVYDAPLSTGGVAGFRDRYRGSGASACAAQAVRRCAARNARPALGGRSAVRVGSQPRILQPAVPPSVRDEKRNGWPTGPSSTACWNACARPNVLPEVRDFPGWKAERRDWFLAAGGGQEEEWHLPGGVHLRVVAQPLPDGGLLLIFEDRTEQVQLASARDTLAARTHRDLRESVRSARCVRRRRAACSLWNNKFRTVWGTSTRRFSRRIRVSTRLAEVAAHGNSPTRRGRC